jgi:hypothetical protein
MITAEYRLAEATTSQMQAYEEGRQAWYNGDKCHRQFADTRLFWEAGREAQRRADPRKRDEGA